MIPVRLPLRQLGVSALAFTLLTKLGTPLALAQLAAPATTSRAIFGARELPPDVGEGEHRRAAHRSADAATTAVAADGEGERRAKCGSAGESRGEGGSGGGQRFAGIAKLWGRVF